MLTYKYVARDPATGQKIKAEVQAESEKAAARLVREQGLTPVEISLTGSSSTGVLSKFTNRISTKEKILFSRQLATLIDAGLPLLQSLRNVSSQTQSKPLRAVIDTIIADIEGGSAFSTALAKHPRVFNQIYISLIAAGETSGTLDKALERIAFQQEKDAEIMAKIKGAMVYPAIVILVMGGVLTFMIVKVLPAVEQLYEGMSGASLPFITRILLTFSNFVINYWWAAIAIVLFIAFVTSRWINTVGGKRLMDKLKMKAWPVGPLFMKLYMARFSRTSTTLVASGVPLLQVLDIVAEAINNVYLKESILRAADKVKSGKSLADSIAGDPHFLQLVPDMLRIGEQSGAMESMLEKTAEYYEKEVDNQVKTISTIIEPVMMVFLGVAAFVIVAAVLLPIYGLAGKTGLGG